MRARKYGAMPCLGNHLTRRHLFFNPRKNLALDEVLEYMNGRCVGKWWEVFSTEISENNFHLDRKKILSTECYAVAWDMVKDPWHKERKNVENLRLSGLARS